MLCLERSLSHSSQCQSGEMGKRLSQEARGNHICGAPTICQCCSESPQLMECTASPERSNRQPWEPAELKGDTWFISVQFWLEFACLQISLTSISSLWFPMLLVCTPSASSPCTYLFSPGYNFILLGKPTSDPRHSFEEPAVLQVFHAHERTKFKEQKRGVEAAVSPVPLGWTPPHHPWFWPWRRQKPEAELVGLILHLQPSSLHSPPCPMPRGWPRGDCPAVPLLSGFWAWGCLSSAKHRNERRRQENRADGISSPCSVLVLWVATVNYQRWMA